MKRIVLIMAVFMVHFTAKAQTVAAIEGRIQYFLNTISKGAVSAAESDSLYATNAALLHYLQKICLKPETLNAGFETIKSKTRMTILTSDDHKLRIYNWDSETGGTMHFFDAIAQYATGNETKVKVLNNIADNSEDDMHTGALYAGIYTMHTKDARTVYLVLSRGIYSSKDAANSIEAISIDGGVYKHIPFFKTKTKTLSSISFAYDNFLSTGDPNIRFSDDRSKLYIPVVNKDNEAATNKSLVYIFDGYQYVYDAHAK